MAQYTPASAFPIASQTLHLEETGAEAIAFDSAAQSFHLLNESAYTILKACTGANTIRDMAITLSQKFKCDDFDSVMMDVAETLQNFREKGLILFAMDDQSNLPSLATKPDSEESPLIAVSVSGTSMFPILLSGDKVLVKRSPFEELKTGEIVVWRDESEGLIAHRIFSIHSSSVPPLIITKGDACAQPDPPAKMGQVLGKVIAVLREGGIQWITELEANKGESKDHVSNAAQVGPRPSFKQMQVLDLQEISAESIRSIERIEDVGLVLLSPANASSLSVVQTKNIQGVFIVPENYLVYTGQPELLPEMLEHTPHPLRLIVSGQLFLTEFSPAEIEKGIQELVLNGQAFVSSVESQTVLAGRTKIVSGGVHVVPKDHVRWIGTSIAGPEYASVRNEPLIALGKLVISPRLENIPESISRFNTVLARKDTVAAH